MKLAGMNSNGILMVTGMTSNKLLEPFALPARGHWSDYDGDILPDAEARLMALLQDKTE